jgi:hypothetical protein
MEKTLIGKEGWLFLQNDSSNEILNHTINNHTIDDYKLFIYEKYIDNFLLICFPNKSYFYRDFLPDGYELKYRPAFDNYNIYLKNHMLDGYDILLKKINHNELVFYKTDTHMNIKGSYYIYIEFLKRIKEIFEIIIDPVILNLKPIYYENLNELNIGIGDLTWDINLGKQILTCKNDIYYNDYSLEQIYMKYIIDVDKKIQLLSIIENRIVNRTIDNNNELIEWERISKYILYQKNPDKKHRVLIFYDSFLLSTLSLYLNMFNEVYMIKCTIYKDIIELIQPDYIFEFRVERFL